MEPTNETPAAAAVEPPATPSPATPDQAEPGPATASSATTSSATPGPATAKPPRPTLPMVRPGERALLLSHREYSRARTLGPGLGDYDLLMREPEDVDGDGDAVPGGRWLPVRADKYLKHRAIGYREAASISELPSEHRAAARERGAFKAGKRRSGAARKEG